MSRLPVCSGQDAIRALRSWAIIQDTGMIKSKSVGQHLSRDSIKMGFDRVSPYRGDGVAPNDWIGVPG
jgi:hypothetical protein